MNISTIHFLGQAINKGKIFGNKRKLEYYLSGNAIINSCTLKKRLLNEGVFIAQCFSCKRTTWLNKKIPLELDHIDGNSSNNILSNLRLLCPNCHSLTPTYRRSKDSLLQGIKEKRIISKSRTVKCGHCNKIFKRYHIDKRNKNFYCSAECFNIENRKCNRPEKEELIQLIKTMPMLQIGKKFGVSDNAVRKWARNYGILPR